MQLSPIIGLNKAAAVDRGRQIQQRKNVTDSYATQPAEAVLPNRKLPRLHQMAGLETSFLPNGDGKYAAYRSCDTTACNLEKGSISTGMLQM
jgi:hypothetical protein